MASSVIRKACIKCEKGGAVATCDGCQQPLCSKHFIEHRQELAVQLDTIGQGYDLCRRDTLQDTTIQHPFQECINAWEEESIARIRRTAEMARADLQLLVDQRVNRLRLIVDQSTSQMQSSRESEDYTEIDLKRWSDQLKDLHDLSERKVTFRITKDGNIGNAIQMIKVYEEETHGCSSTGLSAEAAIYQPAQNALQERFGTFLGKIELDEDGLRATCFASYWDGSIAYGTNLYSSGVHRVRFRIENKGMHNLFFGIKQIDFSVSSPASTGSNIYGWWELDQALESVSGHRTHPDRILRTGDELTMILDCDHRQISLEHPRTRTTLSLPVEVEKCPFPWKIFVTLRTSEDSVRILPPV